MQASLWVQVDIENTRWDAFNMVRCGIIGRYILSASTIWMAVWGARTAMQTTISQTDTFFCVPQFQCYLKFQFLQRLLDLKKNDVVLVISK